MECSGRDRLGDRQPNGPGGKAEGAWVKLQRQKGRGEEKVIMEFIMGRKSQKIWGGKSGWGSG